MVRATLIVLAIVLMLLGFYALDNQPVAPRAGEAAEKDVVPEVVPMGGVRGANVAARSNEPKTQLIGSLIRLLETVDTDDQQTKAQMDHSLRGADKQLSPVLGSNSRRIILQANRRTPQPTYSVGPSPQKTNKKPPHIDLVPTREKKSRGASPETP
ncbi:MAG: hypothetical protein JXB10_02640 [Pirellulales bacterium]|nr:hypothetical protein [Pirellulales bacterium]